MTFRGDESASGSTFLKGLVVVAIIVAALWAANGGLDAISLPEPTTTTTATG